MEAMFSLVCGRNIIAVYLIRSTGVTVLNCMQNCVMHITHLIEACVSHSEITEIINDLPSNRSPGLDGRTSEHLKYASSQLSVLLSILMSAILVHGRVPSAMLKSVMIPIVINKNKHITDKENYRPICSANVIENVLLSRLQNWLSTTCSQFGFKAKHGTEMCVFILRELIRYYIEHGSCM